MENEVRIFFFNITNKFLKNKVPNRFDLHQNKSIETTLKKKKGFLQAHGICRSGKLRCEFAKQNALNTTYNNYKSKKGVWKKKNNAHVVEESHDQLIKYDN